MKHGLKILMGSVFAAALSATCAAHAGATPYPNMGTPNPVTYTFTAAATGPITAYFAGVGAPSYEEVVGLLVNGVSTGITGLNDHTSSLGDSLVLGNVHVGDTLTFVDYITPNIGGAPAGGLTWYSNPALNADGGNHLYSTSAAAGQIYSGSPAGAYVAFEDLNFRTGSDYNYLDDTFVFTNVSSSAPGPVPGAGLAGLATLAFAGLYARTRRRA